MGLAALAGALIADPEFVQFHPTAIDIGRDPAPLATEALRGEGAVLVNAHHRLPVDGQPLHVEGTLVGAPGLANGLGQQLYLATGGGLIKLGWTTAQLGWIQLAQHQHHPGQWLGEPVRIRGWGRRGGGSFWLDVAQATCLNQPGQHYVDQGPWIQTLISLGLALGGVGLLGWG
jgi:succinate dehydrogenase/fumarate reductase flavoprotein subunit